MKKSWANPCSIAYEVKVDRSDFLRDEKWPGYLDYCNQFYFVCPSKLISVAECPEQAGLMWVASTGSRLYTKKKAPRRSVEIPEDIYRYLLMCRVRITDDTRYQETGSAEYWRNWLETKVENRELGRMVSRTLGKMFTEQVHKVEAENIKLAAQMKAYDRLLAWLDSIGIDTAIGVSQFNVQRKIEDLKKVLPDGLMYSVNAAVNQLTMLQTRLIEIGKGPGA